MNKISPKYYKGKIEVIDYLVDKLSKEELRGYLLGNIMKYLSRAGKKTKDPVDDFKKAQWYLNRLVDEHEKTSGT